MSDKQLMVEILKASVEAAKLVHDPDSVERSWDGELDSEEKLKNLEAARTIQVFAAWFAKGLKPENAETFGFGHLHGGAGSAPGPAPELP